jgi:mersacidin/lichenicidin family type 2 lantibiotic
MSNEQIVRAWKDSKFRASLTAEQRQMLPQNPIGELDLSEEELGIVAGGLTSPVCTDYCTHAGTRCGNTKYCTELC